ncbi:hypothetical protein QBC44DRAFT_395933 [Cladorrhinum sp. PSN332]|nr:hypothetical protein QBC44DRAFT_395933 [Cladorrhinum sp. PSN332]
MVEMKAGLTAGERHIARKRRHVAGRARTEPEEGTRKRLACHFSKHPELKHKHPDCRTFVLRGMADLITHFQRRHKQIPFCDRCKHEFPGRTGHEERDEHIKNEEPGCELNNLPEPLGITPAVWQELVKERRTRHSGQHGSKDMSVLEQKWHRIWDIIFPGVKHPEGIFHECTVTEESLHDSIESYLRSQVLVGLVREQAQDLDLPEPKLTRFTSRLLGNFREFASLLASLPEAPDEALEREPILAPGTNRPTKASGTGGTGGTSETQPKMSATGHHGGNIVCYPPHFTLPNHQFPAHGQPEPSSMALGGGSTMMPMPMPMLYPFSTLSHHPSGPHQDLRRHQPGFGPGYSFNSTSYHAPVMYWETPGFVASHDGTRARGAETADRQAQLQARQGDPTLTSAIESAVAWNDDDWVERDD